jgi:hypothetical protein
MSHASLQKSRFIMAYARKLHLVFEVGAKHHFGIILGWFWDHFGIILGWFWAHVGIKLASFLGWGGDTILLFLFVVLIFSIQSPINKIKIALAGNRLGGHPDPVSHRRRPKSKRMQIPQRNLSNLHAFWLRAASVAYRVGVSPQPISSQSDFYFIDWRLDGKYENNKQK